MLDESSQKAMWDYMDRLSQKALWASKILTDCIKESSDDLNAAFSAAEYIFSTSADSYDYPRNKSNQFLNKMDIVEAANDDSKYKSLRDSIPEDQCWKLDSKVAILQGGGTIHHPKDPPEASINLNGEIVDPIYRDKQFYIDIKADWDKREANRQEKRKWANKALRSFRSEYRPMNRVIYSIKKAGATRAEIRSINRFKYELDKEKISIEEFEDLCESVIENVHIRIDHEFENDPEPSDKERIAFGPLDRRGVEHRGGGPDGGQFIKRGTDDSEKSAGQPTARRSAKIILDNPSSQQGTKPQSSTNPSSQPSARRSAKIDLSSSQTSSSNQAPVEPPIDPRRQEFLKNHQVAKNKFVNDLANIVFNNKSLSKEKQVEYVTAINNVIEKFNVRSAVRIMQNVQKASFFNSPESLTDYVDKISPKFKEKLRGSLANGSYSAKFKAIYLDGDVMKEGVKSPKEEVYAHEFAHAIDYNHEFSSNPEWKAAWFEEICKNKDYNSWETSEEKPAITKYATSRESEGFAEFSRMVFGMKNIDMQKVETNFPKCVAFWRKMGIMD